MPHYSGGCVVQVGDLAKGKDSDGVEFVGAVVEVFPGATACDVVLAQGGVPTRVSGNIVLDGAKEVTCTAADLEKVSGSDWRTAPMQDAGGDGSGLPDAAQASGVAEEVGSDG